MFLFFPYSDAQIKQRHNAKMLYTSYLSALRAFDQSYRYKMVWQRHKDGYELLAKQHLRTGKREYLGRRGEDTEHIYSKFMRSKASAKERLATLKTKMEKEAKLNKLEGIARAPRELVKVFRKINELGLDDKLIAIGTNSLYAYEARCGVALEQAHLATRDIDILNRKNKGTSLITKELITSKKAEDLLISIDPSFQKDSKVPYRFENKDGVWIELINPVSDSVRQESFKDNLFVDVLSLSMAGIHWLENSRLFKEMVVGDDGSCANITVINPLEYAVHKNWLGKREDRDYLKHTRDQQQSRLATELIMDYMPNIDISDELDKMRHFKKEVVDDYKEEVFLPIVKQKEV